MEELRGGAVVYGEAVIEAGRGGAVVYGEAVRGGMRGGSVMYEEAVIGAVRGGAVMCGEAVIGAGRGPVMGSIDLRRKTRPSNRLLWGVCSDTLPQNSPCGLEGMQSLCGSACPEFGGRIQALECLTCKGPVM